MRFFLLATLLGLIACTPTTYDPFRDRPDYVDRVLEDVTAMVQGMAAAHGEQVVGRDPGPPPRVDKPRAD